MKKTICMFCMLILALFIVTACTKSYNQNEIIADTDYSNTNSQLDKNNSNNKITENDIIYSDKPDLDAQLDSSSVVIEFKEYIGTIAVVTSDVQLKTPYIVTVGDDDEGKQRHIYEAFKSDVLIKKGDIVIVIEEKDSVCRISPISTGDTTIIRGYIESKNISYDTKDISNANQCCFSDITSYNDNGDELDKISGSSQIYERKNGKYLISLAGGGGNRWVNETDVNYCFYTELTDIIVDANYHFGDK